MKVKHAEHLRLIHLLTFCFSLVLLFACLTSLAQTPPITPSGLNTRVSPPSTVPSGKVQYDITGGTRPGGGVNLFHSFGDFGVPNNNIANFLNDSGLATSNILSRVTGGNISNIFGAIQTTGFGNANLFLMNPAGFLFGPSVTVNVGGMVSFTSADYLRLRDNARFNAVPSPVDALLTAAPVAAFGFLGSNPGAITVQGSQFSVTPGQSISLVGGNITIQSSKPEDGTVQSAKLSAPGGQINLASVASPGELLTGTLAQAPNINGQSFGNLGAVQITEQSVIDVSGNGGGTVLIRGGNFVLDNSTISANVTGPGPVVNGTESVGSGIDIQVSQTAVIQNAAILETNVSGNATPGVQYGGIHVKADSIEIIGSQDFENFPFTGIRSDIAEGSTGGNSGNITLEADSILVQDFGTFTTTLETTTGGAGNAGNITLTANNNMTLDGATIQSMSQSSPGNTGNISLRSGHGDIVMTNFPLIQTLATSGSGNTGTISLVAQRNLSLDGALIFTESDFGSGNPGNIDLTSKEGNISMTSGPLISSQTFNSTGVAGNITVNAPAGDVLLAGGDFSGGLFTAFRPPRGENPQAAGGGAVEITARNLTVHNSALSIDNVANSVEPGDITINLSGTLNLSGTFTDANGGLIHSLIQTTSRGAAPSSDINITAHDVHVSDGARITTEAFASGNAGNLTILTPNLELTNGGQIRSGSVHDTFPGNIAPLPSGAGGTITVQGQSGPATSVLIDGSGSGLFTNTQGTGPGGSILVNANSVTLQNSGILSAETSGSSPSATGGRITVDANQVQVNSGGIITAATTGAGAGGSVNVNVGSTFSSNAGTVSSMATQATGGDINMAAGQSVTLTNGASISASSTGAGNAGNIQINAGNQFAMTDSSVTTEAHQASGGAIKITTTPNGTVQLTDSTISASVLDGTGGGGSVNIDPQYVVLQNSQILANAVFGPGGNINITTNLLLPDSASVISASSQFGQPGTIIIQSPISPASGKIIPLGQKPLLATTLLSQRCAALAGGNASSFTVAGRDALPIEPGGWLSSPLELTTPELAGSTATEPNTSSSQSEPAETSILSLRRIAPLGFLTQNFAVDSLGCIS